MILGITGTLGAGKGEVVSRLVRRGFRHYSVRDFLVKEIERRDLPVSRDTMVHVGNDLRRRYGPGYLALALYRQAQREGGDAVIESVRTPGEVGALERADGFYLIAVDAEPRTRYERVIKRGSSTDGVSFDAFCADEEREMHATDPAKQNIAAVIAQADFHIRNDGTREELFAEVDRVMKEIAARERRVKT